MALYYVIANGLDLRKNGRTVENGVPVRMGTSHQLCTAEWRKSSIIRPKLAPAIPPYNITKSLFRTRWEQAKIPTEKSQQIAFQYKDF